MLRRWLAGGWHRLGHTVVGSLQLWRIAIWVPLLVVIPEFIQHCVEIKIGFFTDRQTAHALSADPVRMLFGYAKVAGLIAAMLAAAAFWARRDGARLQWRAIGLALGWNVIATAIFYALGYFVPVGIKSAVDIVVSIATLPFLVLLIGALFGDSGMTLLKAYRSGWLIAVRIIMLAAFGWIPLSRLHSLNHVWAMGQPNWLVLMLMIFDSLVVGLLACWAGTAFYQGYRRRDEV
jgi:hypothetical protein